MLRVSSSDWSGTAFYRAPRRPSGRERRAGLESERQRRSRISSPSFGAELAIVCFDSSAFVKLLVEEPGSDVAARLWDEADVVVASRLAFPEVHAALAAARRAARLDPAADRRARRDWEEFWSATRVVELTAAVAAGAAALARRLVIGGTDAVHLASAMTMADAEPILVAWDVRLRTAALEAGLAVAPDDRF